MRSEQFETPSVNIIGVVRGTDPALRNEYVVFSSHQDHDGVRYAVAGDSIWNGADDNGSTSVALLAIARAWVKQPTKRSALFIYHGAEERGLLGSLWHAAHPVVPLSPIAAVLNGDMIGRNHPDTASLLGIQPPHRNSTALVQMALDANNRTGKFVLDSLWDRPSHPEGWYFRSDHVPYARLNVPSLFFTTNLHDDYHTPRDNPDRIDYAEAHAHDAVDVPDGLDRGERERASGDRRGLPVGALNTKSAYCQTAHTAKRRILPNGAYCQTARYCQTAQNCQTAQLPDGAYCQTARTARQRNCLTAQRPRGVGSKRCKQANSCAVSAKARLASSRSPPEGCAETSKFFDGIRFARKFAFKWRIVSSASPRAILSKRARSPSVPRPKPSAMLAEIDWTESCICLT